jgi:hypothetical protein
MVFSSSRVIAPMVRFSSCPRKKSVHAPAQLVQCPLRGVARHARHRPRHHLAQRRPELLGREAEPVVVVHVQERAGLVVLQLEHRLGVQDAQAGRLVVCGDAGDALGDSLYEAVIYVRGRIKSLGADAREEPMTAADLAAVAELLGRAGFPYAPSEFKRVASARSLYHWNADADQEY